MPVVVLEGATGAGKTTLASMLRRDGWLVLGEERFAGCLPVRSENLRQACFLHALRYTYATLLAAAAEYSDRVAADTGLLTWYAYTRAFDLDPWEYIDPLTLTSIVSSTHIMHVVLYANSQSTLEARRRSRLAGGGRGDALDTPDHNAVHAEANRILRSLARALGLPAIAVDDKSPREVYEHLMALVRSRGW